MHVYESADYKKILIQSLSDKKTHVSRQFTFQNMAAHCGVQKTYLSKVLNRQGHLTEDQLYLACDFLGFSEEEKRYMLLLYSWEKSQLPKRKENLKQSIQTLQNQNKKTEKRISVTSFESAEHKERDYHLDPYFILIHMFLTIRRFALDVRLVSQELSISETQLNHYLTKLEQMEIIRFHQGKYEVLKDNLHLPENSPIFTAFRTLMRLKALDQMNRVNSLDTYSFSVVFSSTPQIRQRIQSLILDMIKETQLLVSKGREEEVYQMNIDLLNW